MTSAYDVIKWKESQEKINLILYEILVMMKKRLTFKKWYRIYNIKDTYLKLFQAGKFLKWKDCLDKETLSIRE